MTENSFIVVKIAIDVVIRRGTPLELRTTPNSGIFIFDDVSLFRIDISVIH